jgi:phage gp36-like protein
MRSLRTLAGLLGVILLWGLALAATATTLPACAPPTAESGALAPTAMPTSPAYCTAADVETHYNLQTLAELTGDASGQAIDSAVVEAAITSYGGVIHGYVSGRYPDISDDPTLRALNVEGAYLTLCRRRYGGLSEGELGQLRMLRQQLVDIANGTATLQSQPDEGETPALDPDALFRANPRLYGRARMG